MASNNGQAVLLEIVEAIKRDVNKISSANVTYAPGEFVKVEIRYTVPKPWETTPQYDSDDEAE